VQDADGEPAEKAVSTLLVHRDFGFYHDRETEGQFRDADRGPGVGTRLGTPQVEDEVGEAVDHGVVLVKPGATLTMPNTCSQPVTRSRSPRARCRLDSIAKPVSRAPRRRRSRRRRHRPCRSAPSAPNRRAAAGRGRSRMPGRAGGPATAGPTGKARPAQEVTPLGQAGQDRVPRDAVQRSCAHPGRAAVLLCTAFRFLESQLAHPECHRQLLPWCYLKVEELL
jgi:hypothetical protein